MWDYIPYPILGSGSEFSLECRNRMSNVFLEAQSLCVGGGWGRGGGEVKAKSSRGYRRWISVTDGLVEPEPHGGGAQCRHVRVERHGRQHSRALPEGGRGPVHLQRQVDQGAQENIFVYDLIGQIQIPLFFPEGRIWFSCCVGSGFSG